MTSAPSPQQGPVSSSGFLPWSTTTGIQPILLLGLRIDCLLCGTGKLAECMQTVLHLPDMTQMQAYMNIEEGTLARRHLLFVSALVMLHCVTMQQAYSAAVWPALWTPSAKRWQSLKRICALPRKSWPESRSVALLLLPSCLVSYEA